MKTAVFRFDVSSRIGIGHGMRCLELGRQLVQAGWEVAMICCPVVPEFASVLKKFGARLFFLPDRDFLDMSQDAADTIEVLDKEEIYPNWLIVDHYLLDIHWEMRLRSRCQRIAVIDDLADRKHHCDALLDPNPVEGWERRYEGRIPYSCRAFLGPANIILRPEFRGFPPKEILFPEIRRVGVTYGGGDPTGETAKAASIVSMQEFSELTFEIVGGYANPHKDQIASLCRENKNVTYHETIQDMASFFRRTDLVLSAGGGTIWEAFSCSVPVIATTVAANQMGVIDFLSQRNLIWPLGWHEHVTSEKIAEKLLSVIMNIEDYRTAQLSVYDFIRPALGHEVHPLIQYILEE